MKLERRQAAVQARRESGFSWPKLARLAGKALVFALVGTVVQVGAQASGVPFLTSFAGQAVVFVVLYALMFRWINAEFVRPRGQAGRSGAAGAGRAEVRGATETRVRALSRK